MNGDTSGQQAAIRIAERLFTLINDENRIFTILEQGKDPDDIVKEKGKEGFLKFWKIKLLFSLLFGKLTLIKLIL